MESEFDRQVSNFIQKEYPSLAGMAVDKFLELLKPLREKITDLPHTKVDLENGYIPFVIVVKNNLVAAEKMMERVERQGKRGVTKLFPHTSTDFSVRDDVLLPSSPVYLLIDIDRGREYLNVTPEVAFTAIKQAHRSPLTIDEGIALITHFPDFLVKNNCFSLLASRHLGDQRVPAIWINGKNEPHLGWCWDRNPHTWLGSASCAHRMT